MEPEGSSPCSQEPSSGPYPEPDQPSPRLSVLYIYLFSCPLIPSGTYTFQKHHTFPPTHMEITMMSQ
jgi:hypothetical protein